jgi:hypothetical protein
MARRTFTRWVAVVVAGVLVACGAEAEDTSVLGATTEPEQEATTDGDAGAALSEPGAEDERTERSERSDPNNDGETPWHLLPEQDRPVPVEPVDCERASPTPVAC